MTHLLIVHGLVLLQVGSGGKGSAAFVADKRAHPSMQPHMSDEVANLFAYLSLVTHNDVGAVVVLTWEKLLPHPSCLQV
jgi:hypothetical protein